MKKFDYKVEGLTPKGTWGDNLEAYEAALNEYGQQGYNLVEILPNINVGKPIHIFKKEL